MAIYGNSAAIREKEEREGTIERNWGQPPQTGIEHRRFRYDRTHAAGKKGAELGATFIFPLQFRSTPLGSYATGDVARFTRLRFAPYRITERARALGDSQRRDEKFGGFGIGATTARSRQIGKRVQPCPYFVTTVQFP